MPRVPLTDRRQPAVIVEHVERKYSPWPASIALLALAAICLVLALLLR